jgi:hypothetical protein
VIPDESATGPWERFEASVDPGSREIRVDAIVSSGDPTQSLPAYQLHHVLDIEVEIDADAPGGAILFNHHAFITPS